MKFVCVSFFQAYVHEIENFVSLLEPCGIENIRKKNSRGHGWTKVLDDLMSNKFAMMVAKMYAERLEYVDEQFELEKKLILEKDPDSTDWVV